MERVPMERGVNRVGCQWRVVSMERVSMEKESMERVSMEKDSMERVSMIGGVNGEWHWKHTLRGFSWNPIPN